MGEVITMWEIEQSIELLKFPDRNFFLGCVIVSLFSLAFLGYFLKNCFVD